MGQFPISQLILMAGETWMDIHHWLMIYIIVCIMRTAKQKAAFASKVTYRFKCASQLSAPNSLQKYLVPVLSVPSAWKANPIIELLPNYPVLLIHHH